MMRRFGLGLAAAIFTVVTGFASIAAADSGIDPAARSQGMKEAPAVVAAEHLPCTVTDAAFDGQTDSGKDATKYYEVACKEGLGFVVVSAGKSSATPTAMDCVLVDTPDKDGKASNLACKLPANKALTHGLQSFVTASGHDCTVDKERYAGSTASENIYEVSCTGDGGYILEVTRDYSGTPKATDCINYDPSSNLNCALIPRAQQFASLDKLAAASGKPCTVSNRRSVGVAPDGSSFYEFACSEGTGFMVKTDAKGKFVEAIDCGDAGYIGNGCTLTDMQKLQAEQYAKYTTLAQQAGFDCTVSKSAQYPGGDTATKIVELACSNRADGGVGFFPASGTGHANVINCLRAAAEGYRCSLTPLSALYPVMSAQLKARGKGSCVVSNARPLAVTTSGSSSGDNDLIEVACADGGPGWVLEYDYGSSNISDVRNCAQSKSLNGGCTLPRQKAG